MTHVKETRHARLYTGRRQEALKPAGCRCEKLVMGILVADRDGETVKDLCQQDLRLPVGGPRTGPERKAIVWKHRANQSSSRQITSVTTEVLPNTVLFLLLRKSRSCYTCPQCPSCKHVIPPIFVSVPLASNGRGLVNRNVIRVTAFSTKWDCISFSFLCLPPPPPTFRV